MGFLNRILLPGVLIMDYQVICRSKICSLFGKRRRRPTPEKDLSPDTTLQSKRFSDGQHVYATEYSTTGGKRRRVIDILLQAPVNSVDVGMTHTDPYLTCAGLLLGAP